MATQIPNAPRRATLSGAPTYAPPPYLVHAIARLCAAKGVSETRFGRDSIGDPMLVANLRAGRNLRQKTNEKVLAHMAALAAINPPRTRQTPVVAIEAGTMQEAFAQLVDMSPLKDVEAAVDMLIERLDKAGGDTDLEETGTEDGFCVRRADGPGCPISDVGGGNITDELHDGEGDEHDGNFAEDDAVAAFQRLRSGPGCGIADDGEDDGDDEPWHVPATLNSPMTGNEP